MVENQLLAMEFVIIQLTYTSKKNISKFSSQTLLYPLSPWCLQVDWARRTNREKDSGSLRLWCHVPSSFDTSTFHATELSTGQTTEVGNEGFWMLVIPSLLLAEGNFSGGAINKLSSWNPWSPWRWQRDSQKKNWQAFWAAKWQVGVMWLWVYQTQEFFVPQLKLMKTLGDYS